MEQNQKTTDRQGLKKRSETLKTVSLVISKLDTSFAVSKLKIRDGLGDCMANYRSEADSYHAMLLFIIDQLAALFSLYNVQNLPNSTQMARMAETLIDNHHDLSLEDIAMFCKTLKGGHAGGYVYAKAYGKIDLETLNEWLGTYRQAKADEREKASALEKGEHAKAMEWDIPDKRLDELKNSVNAMGKPRQETISEETERQLSALLGMLGDLTPEQIRELRAQYHQQGRLELVELIDKFTELKTQQNA